MECIRSVGPMLKAKDPQYYKVVRVYRNTGKRVVLQRNLSLEQAKSLVKSFPGCLNSMVCFFKQ